MKFRPKIQSFIHTILSVFLTFAANFALAETFTIKVTSGGQPVAGVAIFGTHGINDLAARTTDSDGNWSFDSSVVSSSSFVVGFSHSSKSYRFEPSELTPSVARCPGRICQIDAIQDGNPTVLVKWTVQASTGQPLANMPVTLSGADYPCPKYTDEDGYVIFAVRKHAVVCNDGDTDFSNNNYKIVNLQPVGKSCTFTTALSKKFNVCTSGGDFDGYTSATCTNSVNQEVGNSVSYQVVVTQDNGTAVSGIGFYGVPSLENLSTDGNGKISFSTSQIGASPSDVISLIPVGGGYQFQPPRLDISPNSCANNICKITAFKNGQAQGVLRSNTVQSGTPLSAVEIEGSDKFLCSHYNRSITDQSGNSYLPVLLKDSCNINDSDLWNDPFSFSATMPGCNFTHTSQTPFQLCPSQVVNDVSISAFCGANTPSQYSISGRVFDRDGFPLNQAEILNNDLIVAQTDIGGNYSIIVDENTTPRLSPKYEDLVFDPSSLSLAQISKNYENINFYAVAPDSGGSFAPPPINQCPAKPKYEVSGYVFDTDGSPLEGVTILNNHIEVTTTNQFGAYSFDVEPQEDLWVSAEFEGDMFLEPDGANFDPSAYGYPFNMCDRPEVNFRRTEAISHFLYGKVTDLSGGYPIANAHVILEYEGLTRTVTSNLEGEYLHTVPDGVSYTVRAELAGHIFTPISYDREDADMSFFNYDFNSHISYAPTPTPTFTPTNTATPTNTPTATMTHPPAVTFTPSNTPTSTATHTQTSTPTSTIEPLDPDLNLIAKLIRAPTGSDLSPNLQIHDFNDRGEIIGASDEYPNNPTPGYGYPLLYSNGEWTQLSSTLRMSLLKINNNGDIVGQSITSGNIGIMYLPSGSNQWQKISSSILLPNGYSYGYVRDINNNGELLVNTYKGASSKVQILVIINPNTGTITEVPNPVGIDIVRVAQFNDAKQIVIEAIDPNSPAPGFNYNGRRGFYWDSATGHIDLGLNVIPTGISESGEVVGNIDAANPNNTSFFTFTKVQGVRNIGNESDFVGSYVYGSSSNGEAVLRGRESSGVNRYYIWNPISGLQLLGHIDCEHSYRPGFILFINSSRDLIGTASWPIGSLGSYAYYLLSVGNRCNTPLPTNTPTQTPTSTETPRICELSPYKTKHFQDTNISSGGDSDVYSFAVNKQGHVFRAGPHQNMGAYRQTVERYDSGAWIPLPSAPTVVMEALNYANNLGDVGAFTWEAGKYSLKERALVYDSNLQVWRNLHNEFFSSAYDTSIRAINNRREVLILSSNKVYIVDLNSNSVRRVSEINNSGAYLIKFVTMNDHGEIVGTYLGNNTIGFRLSSEGVHTTFPGTYFAGINNNGVVIGYDYAPIENGTIWPRGFVEFPGEERNYFTRKSGQVKTSPLAINDEGVAIGKGWLSPATEDTLFFWSKETGQVDFENIKFKLVNSRQRPVIWMIEGNNVLSNSNIFVGRSVDTYYDSRGEYSRSTVHLISPITCDYEPVLPTPFPTPRITNTATSTPTSTSTNTSTITPTATNTFTPSQTATSTNTATATYTPSNTPTSTRTFTPSSTPTSTITSTPTRTSSPTATPNYKLRLTSMCSEDPSKQLKWRVTSEFPSEVHATWDVYGTTQKGSITLPAYGEVYFTTERIKNNTNTVRIFVDSKQMDVKASSLQQCATPTPTSTATPEPDDVICHVPQGHPEGAKTMNLSPSAAAAHLREHDLDYPGPCRGITPTPLPTSTNTATPTAEPNFTISGELKGKNGRKLTNKDMNRLLAGKVTVVVKNMVGDKQTYRQQLSKPFAYSFSVPAGYYKVWIEADRKFLKVTSLPRQYTNWVVANNKGFNFGVQISNPAQKRSR